MSRVIASVQRGTFDAWGDSRGFGWCLSLDFEPRDLWLGLYWERSASGGMLNAYLCILPCLPVHLTLWGLR